MWCWPGTLAVAPVRAMEQRGADILTKSIGIEIGSNEEERCLSMKKLGVSRQLESEECVDRWHSAYL